MSGYIPDDLQSTETGQSQGQGSSGPAEQAPQYVTQDVLEKAIQRIEESVSRMVQSQTDRTVGGLRKSVEKRLKEFSDLASEAGVPQEIIEAEKARIWSDAIDEFRDTGNPPPVAPQEEIAKVNQWILEVADELGVAPLYPKDPEFAKVNWTEPNAEIFKAQYDAAIRAKVARRQGKPAPEPVQQPTAPGARAPMMTQGQPSGNPTLEQLTMRLRTLQSKPNRTRAEWDEMKDLEGKITAQLPKR